MSSLTCNHVFFRPEQNAKEGPHNTNGLRSKSKTRKMGSFVW